MGRDVTGTSGVAILQPRSSQSSVLFQNLEIDIGQLAAFYGVGKGDTTDTCTSENDFHPSGGIEWQLGLFVGNWVLVAVCIGGFDGLGRSFSTGTVGRDR